MAMQARETTTSMRFIRLMILTLLGAALVVLGVANMAPIDLYLAPQEILPGEEYVLRDIPLALVIFVAVVLGVVIGELLEYLREAKDRRQAAEKRREVGQLRQEVGRLSARLGDNDDDLPELPAR